MASFMRRRSEILVGIVICIAGLSISLLIFHIAKQNLQKELSLSFSDQTNQMTSVIQGRMTLYTDVVYGAEGLFAASHSVEEPEWRAYVLQLQVSTHYPGISSMLYIPKISQAATTTYPHTIFPYTPKEFYFPITYIAQTNVTGTTTAIGFDTSSEINRATAQQQAVITNSPTATPVVPAVLTSIPVFSIYAPIYDHGLPLDTADERQSALAGYVAASFRVSNLFENLTRSPEFVPHIRTEIYDATVTNDPSPTSLLYDTASSSAAAFRAQEAHQGLRRSVSIPVAGRTWTVYYTADDQYSIDAVSELFPMLALIVGLILSALAAILGFIFVRARTKALSESNIQLTTLVAQMPFGFVIEDEYRKVQYANKEFLTIFEMDAVLTASSLIAKDVRTIAQAMHTKFSDYEQYRIRIEEIEHARMPVFDEKITLADGRVILRDYVPLTDDSHAIGSMWTFKNITEQQKIDEMKSDFVSLVSHQLKTPVAQIKGYVENMLEGLTGAINPKQEDYLHDMLHVANKNSKLIDDLLNVSRIERGLLKLTIESTPIHLLLEDALSTLRDVAQKKGVMLTDIILISRMTNVNADPVKTIEAIRNIVDNAIKFTEPGKAVALEVTDESAFVVLRIADQGTGIDTQVQNELFEKNRVWSGKVKASGAGLGLFLSKQFIELTGGTISFTTKEHEGTTFTIRLPKS